MSPPAVSRKRSIRFDLSAALAALFAAGLGGFAAACGTTAAEGDGGGSGGSSGTAPGAGGTTGGATSGAGGSTAGLGANGGTGAGGAGESGAGAGAVAGAGVSGGGANGGGASGGAGAGGAAGSGAGVGGAGADGGGGTSGAAGSGGGPACMDGLTPCGGVCVNTTNDGAHCGACNAACTGGRTCVSSACMCPSGSCAALPAFPGADGAAGTVSGGRGGDVYHVTLLDTDMNDMRPGTLRYGLANATGARTIVFDVSGVFSLGRSAVSGWNANGNGWDTASRLNIPANVTIAGQTAPGPVVIMGGSLRPGETNIIVRNVLVAPGYGNRNFDEPEMTPTAGDFPDSYVFDAFDISGQRVMIDHVTTVYATDETISMNEEASDITIQYSNISQGQNYPQADAESSGVRYTGHALGSLLQAGSNARVSVLHNLYAHQKGRLPRVGTEADALTVAGVGAYNDFRNNVFYNWLGTAGTGASGQPSQNNFIGNFYLSGPGGDDASGNESTAISNASGGTSIFNGSDSTNTKVHHSGNLKDTNKDSDANDGAALANSDFGSSAFQSAAYMQTPYTGVTATATAAYTHVLQYAGATWWNRHAVDARIVNEVRTGTGKIMAWADDPFNASASEGTEWRALVATPMVARPAGFDTDGDGMPDAWESMHGLNPNAADNNGDADMDGYTNLEEYLNELAAWPAIAALEFTGSKNRRYAEIHNWTIAPSRAHTGTRRSAFWQPSRHDAARITAGTAIVDAVGQHAGQLEVAANATALLDVVDGWLDVAHAVTIGGRVNLRGGALRTNVLERRGSGAFVFTGGTLSADTVRFDIANGGGVIAPGRGVGTTFVAGNLAVERGVLAVDVTERASDTVRASGTVRLAGALRIEPYGGYTPRAGDSWTIVVAEGGVRGSFESVTEGYAVSVAGKRVIVTYGERLESLVAAWDDAMCGGRG